MARTKQTAMKPAGALPVAPRVQLANIEPNASPPANARTRQSTKITLKVARRAGRRKQDKSETSGEAAEDVPSIIAGIMGRLDTIERNQSSAAQAGAGIKPDVDKTSSFSNGYERSLDDRLAKIEENSRQISETLRTRSSVLGQHLKKVEQQLSEIAAHLGIRKSPA